MNLSGTPRSEAETNLEVAIKAHLFALELMPNHPEAARRMGTANTLMAEHTSEQIAAMLATLIDMVATAVKL